MEPPSRPAGVVTPPPTRPAESCSVRAWEAAGLQVGERSSEQVMYLRGHRLLGVRTQELRGPSSQLGIQSLKEHLGALGLHIPGNEDERYYGVIFPLKGCRDWVRDLSFLSFSA